MDRYVAYLDESGHSGPRLLDPNQPVLVVGGFLALEESLPVVHQAVATIEQAFPGSPELKGNRLIKTPEGRERLKDCVEAVLRRAGLPIFWVWEKRFCIAHDVVELYFNPQHNVRANPQLESDVVRTALAEVLYLALPLPFFEQFLDVFWNPTVDGLRANLDELIRQLPLSSPRLKDLTNQAGGNFQAIDQLMETLAFTPERPAKKYRSLGYSSFFQISHALERATKNMGGELRIVHDEQREYGDAFREIYETSRTSPVVDFTTQSGIHVGHGLRPTTEFMLGSSTTDPAIRMADFFVSAARLVTQPATAEVQRCRHTEAIARLLTPSFTDTYLQLCRINASAAFTRAAMSPFYRLAMEFLANPPT